MPAMLRLISWGVSSRGKSSLSSFNRMLYRVLIGEIELELKEWVAGLDIRVWAEKGGVKEDSGVWGTTGCWNFMTEDGFLVSLVLSPGSTSAPGESGSSTPAPDTSRTVSGNTGARLGD